MQVEHKGGLADHQQIVVLQPILGFKLVLDWRYYHLPHVVFVNLQRLQEVKLLILHLQHDALLVVEHLENLAVEGLPDLVALSLCIILLVNLDDIVVRKADVARLLLRVERSAELV